MSPIGSPVLSSSEIDEDELMSDSSSCSSTPSSRASSPQTPASSYRSRPSLTISYPMQPSNATSSRLNITFPAQNKSNEHLKTFVAPAHPQSHHLHVLPPRKKTTKALIIDHTIWRLVRTRFAQARCELGMDVKLKSHAWHEETDPERNEIGFHALHADRHHHGNFGDPPEIDVASSDEEDSGDDEDDMPPELLYGNTISGTKESDKMDVDSDSDDDDGDESDECRRADQRRRTASQNRRHAPFLSARADGMQKVLFAVLFQPNPFPSMPFSQADDPTLYPTSINQASPESLKTMPNRLRLALMLLRIVDDLFGSPKLMSNTAADPLTPLPAAALPPSFGSRAPAVDTLPTDLETLFQVSRQSHSTTTTTAAKPTSSFFRTLPLHSSAGSDLPSNDGFKANIKPFVFSWNNSSDAVSGKSDAVVGQPTSQADKPNSTGLQVGPSLASSKAPATNASGKDPLNWYYNSRDFLDDSRKTTRSVSSFPALKHASGRAKDLYSLGCTSDSSTINTVSSSTSGFSASVTTLSFGSTSRSTSSSTSSTITPPKPGYPIEKLKALCSRHLREKCTICVRNSDARTRIGAGLSSASASWFLDRRRRLSKQTGSILADLISDFMRLSAYIISELQEYVISETADSESSSNTSTSTSTTSNSRSPSPFEDEHTANDHSPPDLDSSHASEEGMSHKPTRAWYSLLCGLITRAVLEGYVSRGWKGSGYVQVLMGLGLSTEDHVSSNHNPNEGKAGRAPDDPESQRKAVDEDDEYLPEGTPSLIEACHILFDGFGKHTKTSPKEIRSPEREYISTMESRLSEFLEIPHSCPDLATHLTGLSAKYPAEPVERAALQFCEAVSKWRGKPELEMYKIKRKSAVPPSPDLWIRKYFQVPVPETHEKERQSSFSPATERGTKRHHSSHGEPSSPVLKKGKLRSDAGESS